MQVNTVEKLASVGAFGLWAALHGWLGWLAVLYAICMLLDCVTGTALAVKEKTWNSSKARKGLWHKGGSTIMICVSVLTDIFLGLVMTAENNRSVYSRPCLFTMLRTSSDRLQGWPASICSIWASVSESPVS